MRRFVRHILRKQIDDFDWNTYSRLYGPENDAESCYFTLDLSSVDYKIVDGRIFVLGDCKPLQGPNRAIIESVINLPNIQSIAEVGTGNGKIIVNIKRILGSKAKYSASDISKGQLKLFEERFPKEFTEISPHVFDLTKTPIVESEKPDVVLIATVLMHIKRETEYRHAVKHLLQSARKYVAIYENWLSHNYYSDLAELLALTSNSSDTCIYKYDSGSNMCIVIGLNNNTLTWPYEPINSPDELKKYL